MRPRFSVQKQIYTHIYKSTVTEVRNIILRVRVRDAENAYIYLQTYIHARNTCDLNIFKEL